MFFSIFTIINSFWFICFCLDERCVVLVTSCFLGKNVYCKVLFVEAQTQKFFLSIFRFTNNENGYRRTPKRILIFLANTFLKVQRVLAPVSHQKNKNLTKYPWKLEKKKTTRYPSKEKKLIEKETEIHKTSTAPFKKE